MTRTRIKFCGITRVEDAQRAADLGVDAIGMVFTRRSPRFVGLPQAAAIVAALPPFVTATALFMDDDDAWVRQVEREVKPSLLQFHGAEPADFCTGFATPYLKAIAMNSTDDVSANSVTHPHARGFVCDGHVAGGQGGQGRTFDWSRIPHDIRQPILLAGGLDAGNVAEAIRRVRPWAVDVSSGIERSPGIKDPARMQAFVKAVQSVPRT